MPAATLTATINHTRASIKPRATAAPDQKPLAKAPEWQNNRRDETRALLDRGVVAGRGDQWKASNRNTRLLSPTALSAARENLGNSDPAAARLVVAMNSRRGMALWS